MGLRHFSLRLFVIAVLAIPVYGQSLDAVLGRLDKAAQHFQTVSANLARDVHTAIVNDDTVESGTIRVRREKGATRMLIDFTAPDKKTVAFDGASVSVYYPKIHTVQIYNVGDKRSLIDQFLLLGFGATGDELKAAYELSYVGAEAVDGRPANHIQLVPKSKDVLMRLKKADLWIGDAGTPLRQKFVTSASGDSMTVTYTDAKLNGPIGDGSLKLSYPKDTKIEHPQF